ncbi:MAG: 3',5'-cyclic-nucleotide phosphodiesterase [Acidobacteria bacterium]|nr:3',5'-cyclic-nucleotide phosphodiesterase [Acidobacteriota bacterium]MBV9475988.1 3',5'-cyclic-nucleotide phosphodiesterase [Acidobacteriota bacterium]
MRLKVLGAYGASDAEHNLTGYLIDDWFAVDAGTLTSKLSFAQQGRIQGVFITHPHADHIRDLPHLIHNRFSQNVGSLTIFAARDVLDLLVRDVFNGIVWPDFSEIVSPLSGKPAVHYRALTPGKRITFNDVALTAVPVDHQIPASGVILELNGQSIVFTGDTGPTQEIWKRTNKTPNVVAVVTEASFPNDQQALADETAHLSPQTFGEELKKITVDAPVYASHRKIPYERDIESQIRNLRDRRARVLLEKNYTL